MEEGTKVIDFMRTIEKYVNLFEMKRNFHHSMSSQGNFNVKRPTMEIMLELKSMRQF
jgi:hypothetical protein